MTVGMKLRKVRQSMGYSIEKVAVESEITYTTVQAWEKDKRSPRVRDLIRVAEFYETDVSDLLLGVDE